MYLSWLHNLTSLKTNHDKAPIGKETSCAHRSHALLSCHYARSMVIWKHCRTGSQRTVKTPVWNRSLAGIPWRIHKFFGLGNQKNTRHHDEVLDDSTRHCGKLLKKYFYSAKTKCCFILLATSQRSRKLLYETGLDRCVIVFCVARRSLHEKRCSTVNTTVQCFDIVQRTQMDFGKEQRSGIRP